jgi:hypothetical protein
MSAFSGYEENSKSKSFTFPVIGEYARSSATLHFKKKLSKIKKCPCCKTTCRSDQFECAPGECIFSGYVCDEERDCANGADENPAAKCGRYTEAFKKVIFNNYNLCSINSLLAQNDQNPAAKCGRYTEAFKKGPIK